MVTWVASLHVTLIAVTGLPKNRRKQLLRWKQDRHSEALSAVKLVSVRCAMQDSIEVCAKVVVD
jgi:hypothetical protein